MAEQPYPHIAKFTEFPALAKAGIFKSPVDDEDALDEEALGGDSVHEEFPALSKAGVLRGSPDQPRDEKGRWSSGGSGGSAEKIDAHKHERQLKEEGHEALRGKELNGTLEKITGFRAVGKGTTQNDSRSDKALLMDGSRRVKASEIHETLLSKGFKHVAHGDAKVEASPRDHEYNAYKKGDTVVTLRHIRDAQGVNSVKVFKK